LDYVESKRGPKRKKISYKIRKALKSELFLEKQRYYNTVLGETGLLSKTKLHHRRKTKTLIKRRVKKLKSNIALAYKHTDNIGFK
jgi:hypothetical protein